VSSSFWDPRKGREKGGDLSKKGEGGTKTRQVRSVILLSSLRLPAAAKWREGREKGERLPAEGEKKKGRKGRGEPVPFAFSSARQPLFFQRLKETKKGGSSKTKEGGRSEKKKKKRIN